MQKYKLNQKIGLKITPQKLQFLQLLSCNQRTISEKIDRFLEENIAIEKEKNTLTPDLEKPQQNFFPNKGEGAKERTFLKWIAHQENFHEQLIRQLDLLSLTKQEKKMGEYIIGSLDERGFLSKSNEILAAEFALRYGENIPLERWRDAIRKVQSLDPPGVGARNLQEYLIFQLKALPQSDHVEKAIALIENFFPLLERGNIEKIRLRMGIEERQWHLILSTIGRLYTLQNLQNKEKTALMNAPDFILSWSSGEWSIDIPKNQWATLRVHDRYRNLLKRLEEKKESVRAEQFVARQIVQAKNFIAALQQRQRTLMRVMKSIIAFQSDFFQEEDEKKLRPMTLKNIAQRLNLDESTISRAIKNKVVATPYRRYFLKWFFGEGIKDLKGERKSSRSIKKMIEELIENEDKNHPLSDEEITQHLQKKSLLIARRTVAKYRKALKILPSRTRKRVLAPKKSNAEKKNTQT